MWTKLPWAVKERGLVTLATGQLREHGVISNAHVLLVGAEQVRRTLRAEFGWHMVLELVVFLF
jgi:hypothetical protein